MTSKTVLLLATLAACGGSTSMPIAPDAGAVTPPDAVPDAIALRQVTGTVMIEGAAGTALANAQICLLEYPQLPCATSDQAGAYAIAIPANVPATFALGFTAPGYLGYVEVTDATTHDVRLVPDAKAKTLFGTTFAYPSAGTGFLEVAIRKAGATVALSTGGTAVYISATDVLDPSLTATSTRGLAELGNIPSGRTTITVTLPGLTCSRAISVSEINWPATGTGTADTFIAPNALTHIVVDCL